MSACILEFDEPNVAIAWHTTWWAQWSR